MWHEHAVERSLRNYQGRLYALRREGANLGSVARSLGRYNRKARLITRNRDRFAPLTGFTAAHLQQLAAPDARSIVNPYALGYGFPSGRVCGVTNAYKPGLIVIGTEHAYDPLEAPVSLAIEGCALSALWRTDGTAVEVAHIRADVAWDGAVQPAADGLMFQQDPSVFFTPRHPRHTWSQAAKVVVGGKTPDDVSSMFARSYMIELSVQAAPRVVNGRPPSEERVSFLEKIFELAGSDVEGQRRAIATLWFHGKLNDPGFSLVRKRLIAKFFGIPVQELPQAVPLHADKTPYLVRNFGDKVAIETRALGGSGGSDVYWNAIREIITPRVAQWAPPRPH